jgi:tetratricopeptide (TPR) repeat protein
MLKPLLTVLLPLAALAGCATVQQPPAEVPPTTQVPLADPETEVMYAVLVGEIAGQLGDLPRSVDYYLRAAEVSDDPRVAERATRIALYADQNEPALAAARRWVELAPDNIDAQQLLGVLYVRASEPEAALPHFSVVIERARDMHGGGFLLIGSLLSRDVDPEQALRAQELLVQRYPDQAMAHFTYANLALRAGQFEASVMACQRALALDPELVDAHIVQARALMAQGKADEALSYAARAVEQFPDHTELRLSYARILVQAKRYDEALTEFKRVVAERPGDADLLYTVALLCIEVERYDQAREYLELVLQTGKHTDDAHYYLGRIAEDRGEHKLAISWYVRVVEGEYALDAQARIANMLAKLGQIDEARQHLQQMRAQTGDQETLVRLYLAEGQLLSDAKRYQEAMDLYNRTLTIFPGDSDLLYARALTAEKLDRLDLLEADLRTILTLDPDNASALNALGYTLADRTDRYQEALDYIQRAYRMRPDDPAIIDSMGWIYFRLGNYAEAERYLRRAYELMPDAEIAAHLAELLWVQGRRGEAESIFMQAFSKDPDHDVLLDLKQRLDL